MTDLDRLTAKLWQLLSEEADDYDVARITRTSRLARDLNLSGIQRLALAYRLEAEFGIRFTDDDFDAITGFNANAGDVLAAVQRLTQTAKEKT